jgi:ferredoxin-NADP reductase
MIRQLDRDAAEGKADDARFTLFHTNRTLEELAYHEELARIAEAQRFDFVYVPSVSRPTVRDLEDPTIGKGRANNLLRHVFELPSKEQADLDAARAAGHNDAALASAVDRAVKAVLPLAVTRPLLQRRLEPGETVVLTCGNPALMADIRAVAEGVGMRFEKEDW